MGKRPIQESRASGLATRERGSAQNKLVWRPRARARMVAGSTLFANIVSDPTDNKASQAIIWPPLPRWHGWMNGCHGSGGKKIKKVLGEPLSGTAAPLSACAYAAMSHPRNGIAFVARPRGFRSILPQCISMNTAAPVGVRIRYAILVFNVLLSEGHLEPDYHFAFLNVP